jgi:hypothetical protein
MKQTCKLDFGKLLSIHMTLKPNLHVYQVQHGSLTLSIYYTQLSQMAQIEKMAQDLEPKMAKLASIIPL